MQLHRNRNLTDATLMKRMVFEASGVGFTVTLNCWQAGGTGNREVLNPYRGCLW